MVRINLLRQDGQPALIQREKRLFFSYTKALFIFLAVLACLGVAGGIYYLYAHISLVNIVTWVWPKKEKAKALTVREDYAPTSLTNTQAVEEIVRERSDTKEILNRKGLLNLSYDQLSFIEKVNYEIGYAKNVVELLAHNAVPGVDFNSIQSSGFSYLQGYGLAQTKEKIVQFFSSFKIDHVKLLPKPLSQIQSGDNGYQFWIACSTKFGLNLEAPYIIGNADIMDVEDLPITLKKITEIAGNTGMRIAKKPARTDAFVVGDCRKYRYALSGNASYQQFASFVQALYNKRIPCAFESFSITATAPGNVAVDAMLLFTTSSN